MSTEHGAGQDGEGEGDPPMDAEADLLPLGLSHQLGQLILGAAQNFNADMNVDMNFFAPVFGGDEDFGFNPGDDELYLLGDSDSDSFADDEESSQIFISLADSHNIRRLSFHKNVEGVHRFPRASPEEWPCYEELYRLLEEVELLGKVWRRRQEHPYTAHIAPAGGSALREGEDYYSSDYEYDSDEEEDFDQLPPGGVNETLTKKKYCQSSKLFNQVFDSVKQFEAFQRSVSKMKKYVFSIIFALFLDSLPTETRFRIPQELWEKVWKFTQNSYFRYKDSVPLHKDSSYYKAGLRAAEPALALLEKERVRELFAAVGNLHMIIFEILFKNPLILQPNPMFELECGEGAQERLGRGVLRAAIQAARTKFSRLQHLEGVLGEGDAPTQAPSLDLHQKIGSGAVLVRDVELQLDPLPSSVAKLDPPSSVIVSSSVCSKFAVTGRYALTEGGEEFGLLLVVVSAVTGAVVQVVRTGHSYQSHLIEVGACGVRRKGGAGWKNHFCITEDRLSFLTRTVDSQGDGVSVWTCALPALPSDQPVTLTAPLVRTVSRPQHPAPTLRHSAGAALGHTTTALLLLSQSPFSPGPLTSLSLYSLDQGELLLEVPWPGQDLVLQGLTDSRVLLAADSAIHFFSLTAGEVVASYSHQQLGQGEAWAGVMDASPGLRQFAIYTPTLSAFRLYRWEEKEMAAPCLVLESGGPLAEAVEGLGPTVRLLAGVLVTNRSRELATSSPQAMEEGRGGLQCHEVTAYSLASAARHQLLAMGADREAALRQEPLLNQLEPRWWDEPVRESEVMKMLEGRRQLWNPERRPVFLITASLAGVLLESGDLVRTLDMSLGPGEVARREAEDLLQGGAGQGEVARHLQGGTSTMEE